MSSTFPGDTNIMLVDDSESVRVLVKQLLTNLGYRNISEAGNGKEALDKLESLSKAGVEFKLMIVDWNMPIMTGIDLLSAMKDHLEFKDIPFLMIATQGDTENVIKAIVLGVNDFVVKPFDENALASKLASIWKRSQSTT